MNNAIEQNGYPHIPGEYGIDFSQLKGVGLLATDSGKTLRYEVGEGYISLKDTNHEMTAKLEDGFFSCRLYTKDRDSSERHPDMYASYFLEVALSHFEKRGLEIEEFRDIWTQGTDTYDKFYRILEETGSAVEAAKSNLPKPLVNRGFTKIVEPDINQIKYPYNPNANCVYARFTKAEASQAT